MPVDRLPLIEWAPWWDKTLDRWRAEGLPSDVSLDAHFGLDPFVRCRLTTTRPSAPRPASHGAGHVTGPEEYAAFKGHLFPGPEKQPCYSSLPELAARQERGEVVVWMAITGFFYQPRGLFGIERHFYSFYDHPDLLHRMNEDLLEFHLRTLEQLFRVCKPDVLSFAEDLSYNHGPMLSEAQFEQFIAPYYRRLVPFINEHDVPCLVDSDGLIDEIIPWFLKTGVDGFLPMERRAGNDLSRIRRNHPRVRLLGGFDKTIMSAGEAALRAEFDRLLPVMRQGGYVPSVDHQTPPDVSLDDYRLYVRLFREYATRAAE